MELEEFLEKLNLAYDLPSRYESSGWGKWNGYTWGWDCVCLIKGILWGWVADTSRPRGGGAVYGSNGVPDIGTEQMINVCENVSSDFSNIQKGEMVYMKGHVGIYVGDGNVIEATAGWNTWKVIKTQVDNKGNRTYNGQGGSNPWLKHGFLPYVNYEEPTPEPTPVEEIQVGDWVVPTRLVNYNGIPLIQYDDQYLVTQLNGDRAVLSAERYGKLYVWSAMNVKDLKKVE